MEYTIFCKNNVKIFLLAVVCLQTTEAAEQLYYFDIVSSWKVNPDLERNHSSTKLSVGIRKGSPNFSCQLSKDVFWPMFNFNTYVIFSTLDRSCAAAYDGAVLLMNSQS